MITTVCKISYGSQTVPPIVPAVQGDTGRAISFEIADFTPPAGATATYFILKPSGEAIYNSATITDNSILCELTAQSLAEAGENRMQVRVLQGENIVTSFEVILMVRTFLGDDAIESGTEMNIFDQAVEQAAEEFQTQAEQIVEEVIESIPSDYTALTEEVDELNERIDNVRVAPRLASVDLNTIQTPGIYSLHTSQTYQNAPPLGTETVGYFEVIVEKTDGGSVGAIYQCATLHTGDGNTEIWERRYSVWNSTWSDWRSTIDDVVRYDIAQDKTDEEKAQARANLGVDSGLNDQLKNAIFNCFSSVAWSDKQGLSLYDTLYDALYEGGDNMAGRYDYEENHPIAMSGTLNTASGTGGASLVRIKTSQTNRRVFGMNDGLHKMKSTDVQELDIYPIPIPEGTTSIIVALEGGYEGNALQFDSYLLLYDADNSDYKRTKWYGGRTGEKLNIEGEEGDYFILSARLVSETYPNPLQPNIEAVKLYFLSE